MSAERITALDVDKGHSCQACGTCFFSIGEWEPFPGGFEAADWLLCQPVRADVCAQLLPAAFLTRFGQRCCT